MNLPKRWRWILAGLTAAVLLVLALRPAAVRVETALVTRDSLSAVITEKAITRARERYVVAVPITGRVTRTRVEAGARVTRGTVLATVTPTPLDARADATARAQLRASEARDAPLRSALSEAENAQTVAARNLERAQALFGGGAISKSALERAQLAAQGAIATRDQRRAALAAAQADVDAARSALMGATATTGAAGAVDVLAPTAGVVLRVVQQSERVAQAGMPLVEIADSTGLEILLELLTEAAIQVRAGNPILLTGWGGDSALHGRVRLVEPAAFTKVSALGVEEQRVNVIGDLFERPAGLGTGFRLQAAITTWTGPHVVTVPLTTLFRRSGSWYVFVEQGGRAHLTELRIGHRGADRAEVLSGLAEGDRVILFPSDLVQDGVRVTP